MKFCFVSLGFLFLFSVVVSQNDNNNNLNILERKAVAKFREMIKFNLPNEYMKKDDFLINWIRVTETFKLNQNYQNETSYAYQFSNGYDLSKALTNLENTLKWRKENKMDEILNEDFGEWEREYPFDISRTDKDGALVVVIQYGKWNIKKGLESNPKKFFRRIDYLFEKVATTARTFNNSQSTWLVNVAGFKPEEHLCLECESVYPYVFQTIETHYPRLMKNLLQVNAPKMYEDVNNNLIKPNLMDQKTLSQVKVYGGKEEWLSKVENIIDADKIPDDYINVPSNTTTTKPPALKQPFVWLNICAGCKPSS